MLMAASAGMCVAAYASDHTVGQMGRAFTAANIKIKPGDVVVIPAGTGHWFTKIDDHISYLMIRIDPDKIVPLKDEAASKADLARK